MQRRLNLAVWLEALVVPAWVAVTAFVMWRVFVQRSLLPAGVLLAGVALVVTWWRGQGKRISADAAAVIADRQAGLGGLLLTRLEVPIGGWEYDVNTRLKTLTMPAIDVRRPVTMLVFAFVFLLVGFLVPQTEHPVRAVNAAAATRVETLAEKLEALAKEEPTDEAAIAELQRLQEELKDGTFDATDWEAADSIEKGLDEKAAEAAAELSRAEQAAKALSDAVAQAQGNESAQRERDELERALMALEASGGSADGQQGQGGEQGQQGNDGQQGADGQQGKDGQQGTDGQQGKDGQQGPSSPSGRTSNQARSMSGSQADQLRRALEQRRQQLSNSFGQGNRQSGAGGQKQAGSGQTRRGKGQGAGEGTEAGTELDPNAKGHASRQVDPSTGHGPGGDTPLVFGDDAEMDPNRLKFEALPKGNGGEAEELYGLKAANPRTGRQPLSGGTSSGAAAGDQAPGNGEAPMLPKNRALIQRYFDTEHAGGGGQ